MHTLTHTRTHTSHDTQAHMQGEAAGRSTFDECLPVSLLGAALLSVQMMEETKCRVTWQVVAPILIGWK